MADRLSELTSILIPTLNEEQLLAPTLRAAHVAFEEQRHEILLADGGSRDGTVAIARQQQVTVIVAQPPRARQLNQGARHAHGDILLFLHADTLLPPEGGTQVQRVISHGAAGGFFAVTFGQQQRRARTLRLIEKGINWRSRWPGTITGDQAIFVRREIFERLGGFRELPCMEDVEFSARLSRIGRIARIDSPVQISPRRWLRHGPVRTTLWMWALRLGFYAGISPERLRRFFQDVR